MRRSLIAACALLALAGPARGADVRDVGTVGPWRVVAGPGHCAASSEHQNGTLLGFGVDVDGNTWMRITNLAWKIPSGSYRVRVQFDRAQPGDMDASASDTGKSITVQFTMDEAGYNLITRGAVLRVTLGSTDYRYALADTAAMMPRLLECVGRLVREANPFAGQPASANPFQGN